MIDRGKSVRQAKIPGKESLVRQLPKRFYKSVSVKVRPSPPSHDAVKRSPAQRRASNRDFAFLILLDGRIAKTRSKQEFALPTSALAERVAAEWKHQGECIDPETMPLTKLSMAAIDAVLGREAAIAAEIVNYAGSDMLCYRAEGPRQLLEHQRNVWDPILAWAGEELGAHFILAGGVMPVKQPAPAIGSIARAIDGLDAFRLAAMHVMTTLTGSALLALAVQRGRLSVETAWSAANIDEDWQIVQWGEDAEAMARRARHWREMQAAGQLLCLVA
jgi:chaperone required for assembly of F1-ATPase